MKEKNNTDSCNHEAGNWWERAASFVSVWILSLQLMLNHMNSLQSKMEGIETQVSIDC